MLVVACFGRQAEALAWARDRLEECYGPVALASSDLSFHHTRYYEKEMGTDLLKRFLAFRRLVPSDGLAAIKLYTNALEAELASTGKYPETRPLNLDPGHLQLGKFLLATTKDQSHRIYLRDGIHAEVTLRFQEGSFHPWPWTYADYREPLVVEFLNRAREAYKSLLAAAGGSDERNSSNT